MVFSSREKELKEKVKKISRRKFFILLPIGRQIDN
jgi:hypothetical protein